MVWEGREKRGWFYFISGPVIIILGQVLGWAWYWGGGVGFVFWIYNNNEGPFGLYIKTPQGLKL